MEEKIKLIAKTFGEEKFKFNESLKYYTFLKLDVVAGVFFVAFTKKEIIKLIKFCRELKVPFVLFGTGTKIVFPSKFFKGVVVKNRTRDIQTVSVKGKVSPSGIDVEEAIIEVDSGVSIAKFIEFLNANNFYCEDFENIPGSIGGSIFTDRFLHRRSKSIKVLDLNLDVEEIAYNQLSLSKHIVLSVIFKIKAKKNI